MPIFEKDGRRILFAHIPKCGGVSLYSSFVGAGWTVKNLRNGSRPGSAAYILKERYGVDHIESYGRTFYYPHSVQHVPRFIWKTWGPFETSFAVVREPNARLLSALRYHHRTSKKGLSFEDFLEVKLKKATATPISHLLVMDGHLIPQHHFIAPETELFRFEDDWGAQISERFGVQLPGQDNKSPASETSLSEGWREAAKRLYKKDRALLDY